MIIDNKEIATVSNTTSNGNINTTVGTNGMQGGDSGHGSRTYISLENLTNINLNINNNDNQYTHLDKFEIIAKGDWELQSLIESFEFILKTLKDTK